MRKTAGGLATGLTVGFPFYLWLAGWEYPYATALYLVAAGGVRLIGGAVGDAYAATDWIMILLPLALATAVILLGAEAGLYYPVAINLGFLLIFYTSLSAPKNFIQRIAERIEKRPLDSVGVTYTVGVTRLWCLLFFVNAMVAMFLAWRQLLHAWTLYNGVIAYLLIGVLLIGERLVRPWVQQKMRQSNAASDG